MKFFNTAGLINPNDHYFIPHRFNEQKLLDLIDQKKYFILHAPRQSGKTTSVLEFINFLNKQGKYKAFYINVEAAQASRSNLIQGLRSILNEFKVNIGGKFGTQDPAVTFLQNQVSDPQLSGTSLYEFLYYWSQNSEKPIILFIDEIDALVGDTLISVLRQLRSGYAERPQAFPQSICLIGVRDVRDYRIWSDNEQATILGGSAFNIKAESLVIPDFTLEQVKDLYLQHTAYTGQKFTDEAIEYAFYLTQGQPWLVNALAYQACFRDITDRNITITKEIVDRAKEELIKRQDTHLDVLISRLNEPRVRNVIDAIINSDTIMQLSEDNDDIKYVTDLGLIKTDPQNIWIANPIYKEILPRALSSIMQAKLSSRSVDYQNADGTLNTMKLLDKFVQFYRENSATWLKDVHYKESGPHLLLMAFLQRVINGGGTISREYALGRKRVDLLICYGKQRILIELKVKHSEKTLDEGLKQTAQYMDSAGNVEAHLVIFDRNPLITWDEKIFKRQEHVDNKIINVWGL